MNLNLSPHSLEHLPKISQHQFNSSENQHRLPEQYWLLLTLYSIAFRDFPAMLTSPFMSLVWSPSTQVGMETAFIIHYPYSCLNMKVTVNFLDWVSFVVVLTATTSLLHVWETWMTPTNKSLLVEIFLTRRLAKSLAFCKFASFNFRNILIQLLEKFATWIFSDYLASNIGLGFFSLSSKH